MTSTCSGAHIARARYAFGASVTSAAGAMRAIDRCRTFRTYDDQLVNRDDVEMLLDAEIPTPSPSSASRGPS